MVAGDVNIQAMVQMIAGFQQTVMDVVIKNKY
jgi:hypothetical protein